MRVYSAQYLSVCAQISVLMCMFMHFLGMEFIYIYTISGYATKYASRSARNAPRRNMQHMYVLHNVSHITSINSTYTEAYNIT